jgi:hypothetical protein
MHTTSKVSPIKRVVRFLGIVADAHALRVNRSTLYRTLTGEWKLPGLLGRYAQLKAAGVKSNQRARKLRGTTKNQPQRNRHATTMLPPISPRDRNINQKNDNE